MAGSVEVLYFAWVRDRAGLAKESVELPEGTGTVADLVEHLRGLDPRRAEAFADLSSVRAAVNQEHVPLSHPVAPGDEVAFFPPMTGSGVIRLQREPFDPGREADALVAGRTDVGGVATFAGRVRGEEKGVRLRAMTLEHYPGMTERAMERIEREAVRRWELAASLVIHRYGRLEPGEPIVFVATCAAHRRAALESCQFLIDWLKTKAPFWKLEETAGGEPLGRAGASDDDAAASWENEAV